VHREYVPVSQGGRRGSQLGCKRTERGGAVEDDLRRVVRLKLAVDSVGEGPRLNGADRHHAHSPLLGESKQVAGACRLIRPLHVAGSVEDIRNHLANRRNRLL
jgi:hypothetical protein